jgi:hypothetical protein
MAKNQVLFQKLDYRLEQMPFLYSLHLIAYYLPPNAVGFGALKKTAESTLGVKFPPGV